MGGLPAYKDENLFSTYRRYWVNLKEYLNNNLNVPMFSTEQKQILINVINYIRKLEDNQPHNIEWGKEML